MNSTTGKADRLLQIYSRLVNGEILSKKEMAARFHITERSVQRDVEALRCYFQEEGLNQDVIHDRKAGGYRLQKEEKPLLNNGEILAVCKILLESRSMKREEMFPILEKLTSSCVPPKSRAAVDSLISNEKFHYIEPHHGKSIIPGLWDIAQAVQNHYVMEIEYERMKAPNLVKRTIEPVGSCSRSIIFIWRHSCGILTEKRNLPIKMISTPPFTGLTASAPLKSPTNISKYHIKTVSRKANSGNACSLCTAGS